MSESTLPTGAPEEVVTKALIREVDLTAFGASKKIALITIDNGLQPTKHLRSSIIEGIGCSNHSGDGDGCRCDRHHR
jgi:hypothetical protein